MLEVDGVEDLIQLLLHIGNAKGLWQVMVFTRWSAGWILAGEG